MVIDSHALLWWLQGGERLSRNAADFLALWQAGTGKLVVAAASLWELEWKRRQGKLPLPVPVREWVPRLRSLPSLALVNTEVEVWLLAAELDWDHSDPIDRIIAATALSHGVPVLTKDMRFHHPACPVKAIW